MSIIGRIESVIRFVPDKLSDWRFINLLFRWACCIRALKNDELTFVKLRSSLRSCRNESVNTRSSSCRSFTSVKLQFSEYMIMRFWPKKDTSAAQSSSVIWH